MAIESENSPISSSVSPNTNNNVNGRIEKTPAIQRLKRPLPVSPPLHDITNRVAAVVVQQESISSPSKQARPTKGMHSNKYNFTLYTLCLICLCMSGVVRVRSKLAESSVTAEECIKENDINPTVTLNEDGPVEYAALPTPDDPQCPFKEDTAELKELFKTIINDHSNPFIIDDEEEERDELMMELEQPVLPQEKQLFRGTEAHETIAVPFPEALTEERPQEH